MKQRENEHYEGRIDERLDELERTIADAAHDVKRTGRDARKEVNEVKRHEIRRVNERMEEIEAGEHAYGYRDEAYIEEQRERADEIKDEIRDQARRTKERIKGRVDRFEEGEEALTGDLQGQRHPQGTPYGLTSPITREGNYRAADREGTLNNYGGRVDIHAGMTEERIRGEVSDFALDQDEKIDDLGRR